MNSPYPKIPGVDRFFWKQESDGSFLKVVGPWYWENKKMGNINKFMEHGTIQTIEQTN